MQVDFYNPRSIILFVCILQGLIFAALLAARGWRKKSRADFWLAALLILLCAGLITPLVGFANVYDLYPQLTFFPFAAAYTYGVCIYFYVRSLTDARRRFAPKDAVFFVPAILYLLFRFTLFAQTVEVKNRLDDDFYSPFAAPFIFVTEFVWNICFLYFSIVHYRKYRQWLDENYSDTEKIKFDWLRNFLYLFTFILVCGAIFDFIDSFVVNLSYIQYFYFELFLAFATYYLAIAGYLRSETIEVNFAEPPKIEQRKALLSETDLEKFKIKLRDVMTTKKPYLDPQFALSDLAKELGVNTTVLSYAINHGFDKNFNDFVNEFRIGAVKEKLQNGAAKNSTLLGIALECGFNSKATFNRAFKKFTGVAPKEFAGDAD